MKLHPFISRIRQEREIIRSINANLPTAYELSGLGENSILKWADENSEALSEERVSEIRKRLLFLSRKLREKSSSSHRGAIIHTDTIEDVVSSEKDRLLKLITTHQS